MPRAELGVEQEYAARAGIQDTREGPADMRARWVCWILAISSVFRAAFAAAPELPEAERAVQDTVDHWGQAFSDQHRVLEERYEAFEKAQGTGPLDYVLGVESSLRKTFPDKYRFKGAITDRVRLVTARNESEAFQLAIIPRMGVELEEVAVTVSDFRHETKGGQAVIAAAEVRVRRVGFVETAGGALWPDPLLAYEPFSVGGRNLGLLWIEVKTPVDAAPGDYSGTVTVRPANAAPLQLWVTLHVWDFAIPDRVPMPMMVWTRESAGEAFLKTAELLLAHHVDPISVGQNMDLEELDRTIPFCLERGLMHFQTPGAGDLEAFRPYYEHLRERGWLDKALLYGAHDEPLRTQFEAKVVPQTVKMREAFPGLRVFLASAYHEGMDRGTDIHLVDLSTNFHEWLAAGRPGEQELWWYFCGIPIRAELRRRLTDAPRMLIDRDAVEHRIVYWLAHHYDVEGLFIYAGDRWPGDNDRWPDEPFKLNQPMHYPYAGTHYGDGFIVYPGPRPSIRLKNIRDGAEDHWYLTRVSQLADTARSSAQAKRLLDGIRPDVFVDTHYFNRRPEALLDCRERLGQFIEDANKSEGRYRSYVQTTLDTLIEHGRDRYGDAHSPLFAAILDPETLTCPEDPGPCPILPIRLDAGRPKRRAAAGANQFYDQATFLCLDWMSRLTGDPKYREAAMAALRFQLNVAVDSKGFPAWGGHCNWNFYTDSIDADGEHHELWYWPMAWYLLWAADQEKTRAYADRIWKWHIVDKTTGETNRHSDGQPGWSFTYCDGVLMSAWAFAATKIEDPKYPEWCNTMAGYHWGRRNPATGLSPGSGGQRGISVERFDTRHFTTTNMPWAKGLIDAGLATQQSELVKKGRAILDSYARYGYDPKTGLFYGQIRLDGTPEKPGVERGLVIGDDEPVGYLAMWDPHIGWQELGLVTAQLYAWAAEELDRDAYLPTAERFGRILQRAWKERYAGFDDWFSFRDAVDPFHVEVYKGGVLKTRHVPPDNADPALLRRYRQGGYVYQAPFGLFADDYGRFIQFALTMERLSQDERWRTLAVEAADEAVAYLWRDVLFVGHPHKRLYENSDLVGILLHAVLQLDAVLAGETKRPATYF